MADGQVVFEITADGKHVKANIKDITKAIETEGKKWDKAASDSTEKMGKSFLNLKTIATTAVAAIGAAIVKFGMESIEAASDLREVQNVVDTVFGDGAAQIETWAKKAGDQFGLTETKAKKFTSTLGAMMKSSGLAGDQIVGMSTDLAGLAADMASFYNLEFDEAFDKIKSGISGVTMPLKALGIDMSVANLNAFALAQGMEKTFDQMDQSEQTMLRYQYLMSATADAQGDFEKTSDGFANAQRRIQASIESIETSVGNIMLPSLEKALGGVASFLAGIASDMMPEKTVIDEFNEIQIDTDTKMASLNETYEKAEAIIKLIDEISKQTVTLQDGSSITFEKLFADLGNIEANGGDVRGYLANLGVDVDSVIQKYNVWKESTRQLTSLVPALTEQIDSETHAIDGGTEALQTNLDEWKSNEEKKLQWASYYAKARALEERKAQQYLYEYDAGVARQRAEKAAKALANVWGATFDKEGNVINDKLWSLSAVEYEKWIKDVEHYNILLKEQKTAEENLANEVSNDAAAEEYLADEKERLIELYGEEEQAANDAGDAVEGYKGKSEEAWAESVKGAKEAADAIKAVTDYYKGVRDATEQAVNSTIKGFGKIGKAGDDLRKQQDELGQEAYKTEQQYADVFSKWGGSDLDSLKRMSDNWDNLTDKEKEAYNALAKIRNEQKEVNDALDQYKPAGMQKNLQDQIDYMEEYLQNLDKLKEYGVSDELLASLSDGSKESAEYLKGLVEGGPEAAQAVDELYQKVEEKKKGFTDALTEQKLTVDETYSALVKKAKETMGELDLGEEAANAMGSTVLGIASGIRDNVDSVSSAVDELMKALEPLTSLGFSWGFKGGSFMLELLGIPKHETGLNYVPFDGYLASLHEGEGILSAEENRVWQRFKNGDMSGRNVDYEALGGVMRDNVHAGGNVYLDGRTVGRVVSDMQGNQYRSLQRSGWQQ